VEISLEVRTGSRSINGVEVVAVECTGNIVTFKFDRREVRLQSKCPPNPMISSNI
jgi:hypothetical protein